MPRNKLRQQWDAGEIAIDCWLSGSSMTAAEAVGRLGFESVVIDTQHTMADFRDVAGCLMALTGTGTTAIVRVIGNEPLMIQKILDAGADGIMCPMVSTAAEAEAFVGACRYPPLGYRSVGAYRPAEGMLEYFRSANQELVTLAQIETVEAMDNLDAIAATPGLDVLFMGPGDLSVSYGGEPVIDYTDPVTADRHRRVVEAAHAAGKKAGMLALGPGDIARAVDFGMDMVSVAMEGLLVVVGAAAKLAEGREAAAARAEAVPA
ncbi:2,4-dihydroxyhept-2-ene-1,7-dioic acid aldolase [Solirubrobacter sp. CPCC 204708]|uniref:Aldolase/citrate lyase family protein n=1 Tax=Solirubrobacter deserti TaxID=2282478 RepID=A0ABT4RGP1_9ACTN|nr:aldolase/citrate lyase family protein [Solirubrobacter deserti]MBE2318189.1 2,4-dihydroxyhept-2-ene-1,7-dioic acid aldolase [Solirubrobacter deserti]MDA0137470.1 aldolase/citrate lyase family protein [Solirubrobacter deserti]